MDKYITLSNNVKMPVLIQGMPLIMGLRKMSFKNFEALMNKSIENGILGFDTSHDYGNSERFIGKALKNIFKTGLVKREDVFVTTKIGNSQQYQGNISSYVDEALKVLKLDYIDLVLLHWPIPGCYIENWKKLEKEYERGKVKAIGLANGLERHLNALFKADINYKPQVVQFEYHPFRTVPRLVQYCRENGMAIQAYSSLCTMIPLVTENKVLKDLSQKYNKSIPQIILRWDIQQGITPLFSSYKEKHVKECSALFDFQIEKEDMEKISGLNIDYKYHPESLNCPGF
jgi:diketogulonate reductase-like aldo/keto reductase